MKRIGHIGHASAAMQIERERLEHYLVANRAASSQGRKTLLGPRAYCPRCPRPFALRA